MSRDEPSNNESNEEKGKSSQSARSDKKSPSKIEKSAEKKYLVRTYRYEKQNRDYFERQKQVPKIAQIGRDS